MNRRLARLIAGCCAMAAAVLLSAACDSRQEPSPSVSVSPQEQKLLAEMNALGRVEAEGNSYKYRLLATCRLEVEESLEGSLLERHVVSLQDASYVPFAYATGLGYALRLASDPRKSDIYRAMSLEQIERMQSLFDALTKTCIESAPAS
ncbi:MAG TPA: hypothetical protein VM406_01835 [Noviherbaspirillum sp.]|nr:hypothetical protein [Noviherbaspirillum sp.]